MSQKALRRVLLVDGNNIIHAWPDLLELHERRRGLAHVELTRRLTAYQDTSDVRVVVVFDGRGDRVSEDDTVSGVQVFYSDKSHTADDIIERLTGKYSGQYDLTVATDDRAEQFTVEACGGHWISSVSLRALIDSAEKQFRKRWLE